MTVTGYQFDRMRVTPQNDAILNTHFRSDSLTAVINDYKDELKCTASGLNVYVNTGAAMIYGRMVEVTETHIVTVPSNSTGYICVTVDLTKENTSSGIPGDDDYAPVNNQVRVEFLTSLNQQDLRNDGKIYTLRLYNVTSNASSVTLVRHEPTYASLDIGWTSLTLVNGHVSNPPPQFKRTGRMVYLTGSVTGASIGAANGTLAVLPEGCRPQFVKHFIVSQASTIGDSATVYVYSDGRILVAGGMSNAKVIHLDQVTFEGGY